MCGTKEFNIPDPIHTEPKAHAEEEEMSEDKQRSSKLPGDVVGKPRSRKDKRHALKDSLPGRPKQKGLTQWASHGSMVEEQFQGKLSPLH